MCHECRAPRFGRTCDKEVSGIIHILSFISYFELKNEVKLSLELKEFIDKLKKEYQTHTNN